VCVCLLLLLLTIVLCRVHVYNVNDLLLCALPYHATPEFARLLVLLQLKGSAWEWLTPGQQSGAPPPREAIVRRCVNDHVSVCATTCTARLQAVSCVAAAWQLLSACRSLDKLACKGRKQL
jgi:hypothetical protein